MGEGAGLLHAPCHHFLPQISGRAGLTRLADNSRFLLLSVLQTTLVTAHICPVIASTEHFPAPPLWTIPVIL